MKWPTAFLALLLGIVLGVHLMLAQQAEEDGFATPAPDPQAQRIQALERQLVDRDNEILHLRAEWANCKASVESLDLTSQVADLVRRCEAAYNVACAWDDQARRIVRLAPKEKP